MRYSIDPCNRIITVKNKIIDKSNNNNFKFLSCTSETFERSMICKP